MNAQAQQVFPIFIGVWILLGAGSAAFFLLNSNAGLKRKVLPPFVIGTSILFLGFNVLMGFPLQALLVTGPVVALIAYLNLRATKFCDACGKTLMNQNPFSPAKYCSRCGAELK